jgi:hypothetical protein
MASPSAELRRAAALVLAPLVAIPLVARLADAPPASLAGLASFAALAWVPVLLRPLVVAIGFSLALFAVRARVAPHVLRSRRRAAVAVVVVLAGQLVGSLVVQAAGAAAGVPLDLAIGAAAALLAYAARRGPAVPSAAT